MTTVGKPFFVDTQPTKDVVVSSLTRDATVRACIFDLIDNSIDAARNRILGQDDAQKGQLPESYEGYFVSLHFSGSTFKISDNCGGMSVDQLKSSVLRFGERSAHDLGIGVFGVGLNRALFKLGSTSTLKTDDGARRAELTLNTAAYLKAGGWSIPAVDYPSNKKLGTEIEISGLPSDIASDFGDKDWVVDLRHEIGRRYGRYVAKQFAISVNKIPIKNEEVPIRKNSPYQGESKFFKTPSGVSIYLEYGQHRDHRFSNEKKEYDKDRNSQLTNEYGWNVLCNDRAVLIADRTSKTGWDTKFHSEFYGFVGFVRFVCDDPSKLPWNTTKLDVDLNNDAYQRALIDMRKFAVKWRKLSAKRKREKAPPRPVPPEPKKKKRKGRAASADGPAIKTKEDPNQFRTVLPDDLSEHNCYDKHLTLVHEAKSLDLYLHPYTAMALIRMLFEATVVSWMVRNGQIDALKAAALAELKQKKTVTPEEEKRFMPSFDDMRVFLDNNPTIWGGKANYLKHSLKRLSGHQQKMNSAIHNVFEVISWTQAVQIRDDALPLLRHLIES